MQPKVASYVPVGELPAWPVYALFAAFPVWWLLGFASFAVASCAVPMAILLIQRRGVYAPAPFALWVVFLAWAFGAALQLQGATKFIGFGVRYSNMVGAGVVFLYIYNARTQLSRHKMFTALIIFFAFVVLGGFLGVLIPHGSFSTVAQKLLPASIRSNGYVLALVHPSFAEVQKPYGSPRAFYRPSAPFPYTNSWGCNMALLVPLMVAAFTDATTRRRRTLIATITVLAIFPALASLNRGMFLALGVGLTYVAIRLMFRGHLGPFLGLLGAVAMGLAIAVATGFLATLNTRLHYSHTNLGRATVYQESLRGALSSPIFGYGGPTPSQTVDVSIGTQGLIWNLMFSYGFIALGCFVGWFIAAAWRSRRAAGLSGLWVQSVLITGLVTFIYYGYDGPQLAVLMAAAALALREVDGAALVTRASASAVTPIRRWPLPRAVVDGGEAAGCGPEPRSARRYE